jgi:myo-inositol-1(or 4)-monophosphatase
MLPFSEFCGQCVKVLTDEKMAITNKKFGEWSNALYRAILAARLGREVLLKYMGRLEHVEKKFKAGFVSEADKESEKKIFEYLRKYFPGDEFVGEESAGDMTKVQTRIQGKRGRWVVDPLDGTSNYIHQLPIFCVSIGYEFDGQTQIAVIDVPMMNEVYTAVRGCGAYLNGNPIHVSDCKNLQDAFVATGFFNEEEHRLQEQLKLFTLLVKQTDAIRRAGAAAYDLSMVARGVFDAYWERGIRPWDSSAGQLLVEEAGGKVVTYRGQPYDPYKNSIVAGPSAIVDQIVKSISGVIATDSD